MSNFNWSQISDDDLLSRKLKDLPLSLEESDIYPLIQKVMAELHAVLPHFQPYLFVGDEWFSPEGVAAVSIPFFLLNSRLRNLTRKTVLDCEGEKETDFAKYLRHELGHAFDHAFKLSKRRSWEKVFGSHNKEYDPNTYRPRPYSKNFVINLHHWYAQAHPDEDFAETFAVWLNPESDWRNQYKKWGALGKLEYVESVSKEVVGRFYKEKPRRMISETRFLNTSLRAYYKKQKKEGAEDYPDFYDNDLLKLFELRSESNRGAEKAHKFMQRQKKFLLASTCQWTNEKKVVVNELITRLIDRSRELDLVLSRSEYETAFEISAFITTLVSHYLFTGHFRRTV